jgi:hypothetical protein
MSTPTSLAALLESFFTQRLMQCNGPQKLDTKMAFS